MTEEEKEDASRTAMTKQATTAAAPAASTTNTTSSSSSSSKRKDRPKKDDDGSGGGAAVPGAVPVRGMNSIDQSNDDHDNIIDDDDYDDDDKKDAGDIESGKGTGKTVPITTTEPVVEAELVVEEAPKPLEPVYDAEEVAPQCSRNKVWAGVAITLIVAIVLVLVGIFVIAPNNDDNGDKQEQDATAEAAADTSTTVSAGINTTSSPTTAPTFDPNIPHWLPRGEFLTWKGVPDDGGFGVTVDMSNDGNVLAVAAPASAAGDGFFAAGQILVYEWNDVESEWQQRGSSLSGPGPGSVIGVVGNMCLSGDGTTVAFSSTSMLEGAGLVQVWKWQEQEDGDGWTQLGSDMTGQEKEEQLGRALSLSDDGSVLALGALPYDTSVELDFGDYIGYGPGTGRADVYDFDVDLQDWKIRGDPIFGYEKEDFGRSVELSSDGNIVAVKAFEFTAWESSTSDDLHGRTVVYRWTTTGWTQLGQDIIGASFKAETISISADGLTLAIVADSKPDFSSMPPVFDGSGNLRVFTFKDDGNGGVWTQKGNTLYQSEKDDRFHISLSADGQRLAVSYELQTDPWTGKVSVFEWYDGGGDGEWVPIGQELVGAHPFSLFGHGVAISADGSILAIGSPYFEGEDTNGAPNSPLGRAEVYSLQSGQES